MCGGAWTAAVSVDAEFSAGASRGKSSAEVRSEAVHNAHNDTGDAEVDSQRREQRFVQGKRPLLQSEQKVTAGDTLGCPHNGIEQLEEFMGSTKIFLSTVRGARASPRQWCIGRAGMCRAAV